MFPIETRFIVDPDGLITLVDALSDRWSPNMGDKALRRFDAMMRALRKPVTSFRLLSKASRRRITGSRLFSFPEYSGQNLGETIGLEHYDATLAQFLQEVEDYRFQARWLGTKAFQFRPYRRQARRFKREQILALSAGFVQRLFSYPCARAGKRRWCEDTPSNLLHADFLLEMFPNLRLLHIFRDPRDVVASYTGKPWAPSDPELSLRWVSTVLERWLELRERIPPESFLEIKFEDLIADPEGCVAGMCAFLGLDFHPTMVDIDLSRHNIGRWRREPAGSRMTQIQDQTLSQWMLEKGYAG